MGNFDPVAGITQFIGLFVCLTMHQATKAIVAKAQGDKSSSMLARATLNPIPHIDLVGTIILPIVFIIAQFFMLFGWAKPIFIDSRYFKNPKRSVNLIHLGGISFFILLLVICVLALKYIIPYLSSELQPLSLIVQSIIRVNLVLFLFNILPIPGSDTWGIMLNSVKYPLATKLQQSEQMISLGVLMLFILESQGIISIFRPLITLFFYIIGMFL